MWKRKRKKAGGERKGGGTIHQRKKKKKWGREKNEMINQPGKDVLERMQKKTMLNSICLNLLYICLWVWEKLKRKWVIR